MHRFGSGISSSTRLQGPTWSHGAGHPGLVSIKNNSNGSRQVLIAEIVNACPVAYFTSAFEVPLLCLNSGFWRKGQRLEERGAGLQVKIVGIV